MRKFVILQLFMQGLNHNVRHYSLEHNELDSETKSMATQGQLMVREIIWLGNRINGGWIAICLFRR